MFRSTFAVGIAALMGGWGCARPAAISHRPNDAQCSTHVGPGDCRCAGCAGPEFTCTTDTGCTQGVNGRCIGNGAVAGCSCTYDKCSGDSDCPSNGTCACHDSPYMYGSGNRCVLGNCRVDSDCGKSGFCSPSGQWSIVGYYCH